jgi:hypothetical protein
LDRDRRNLSLAYPQNPYSPYSQYSLYNPGYPSEFSGCERTPVDSVMMLLLVVAVQLLVGLPDPLDVAS